VFHNRATFGLIVLVWLGGVVAAGSDGLMQSVPGRYFFIAAVFFAWALDFALGHKHDWYAFQLRWFPGAAIGYGLGAAIVAVT
jgi:hypothetical protein